MRTLYNNVHLIVDEKNEYLDSSILINDKYIEEIFIHSNKININETIDNIIDCHKIIFIPTFFDPKKNDKEQNEVSMYYELNNNPKILTNPLSDDTNNIEVIDDISLANQLIFNDKKAINYAFYNNVPILFGTDKTISDEYIKFVIKNIDKDKLMLISYGHDNIIDQVKRLIKLNIPLTDIVAYTSSNAYKIYGINKEGKLIKGMVANIVCIDPDNNNTFTIREGEKNG